MTLDAWGLQITCTHVCVSHSWTHMYAHHMQICMENPTVLATILLSLVLPLLSFCFVPLGHSWSNHKDLLPPSHLSKFIQYKADTPTSAQTWTVLLSYLMFLLSLTRSTNSSSLGICSMQPYLSSFRYLNTSLWFSACIHLAPFKRPPSFARWLAFHLSSPT